jgi:ABC-2 type transport system permease protein/lipopolysaccharide transport system permease protein
MTDSALQMSTAGLPADLPVREIRPVKRRLKLSEAWTNFPVTRIVGIRDMRLRYKQAALGPLWLLIGPLGMLVAVTVAFSGVTKVNTHGIPYVLFALVGLSVWTYVQNTMATGAQALVMNSQLVRRSACPRLALVNATLFSNLPPASVMLTAALVGVGIDRGLPMQALLLPVMIVWLLGFTWGLTLVMSAVAARFRDIISLVPLIAQAGIFITPVGYPLRGAPSHLVVLLACNPVSGIVEMWRWCLLGTPPLMYVVLISLAWTGLLMVGGWRLFSRMEVRLADYL